MRAQKSLWRKDLETRPAPGGALDLVRGMHKLSREAVG